jgi:hypothetical protein
VSNKNKRPAQRLKRLQTMKRQLLEEGPRAGMWQEAVRRLELDEIDRKIAQLQRDRSNPVVSEHSMLRYLERVHGIDLVKVEQAILTTAIREAVAVCGNGKFPSGTGFRAVVQDNTVVTVEV